jgi:predicted amidophosphoribosyltransferase
MTGEGAAMHPEGRMCLVCQTRTTSEGQLCPKCVKAGHRVENDTLIVNMDSFLVSRPGTSFKLMRPIQPPEGSSS